MSVMQELDQWHELIKPVNVDLVALYKKLTLDELEELQHAVEVPEIVKEACDVIVTARGMLLAQVHPDWVHLQFIESMRALILGFCDDWEHPLHLVNQSNFSKLILKHEVDEAMNHFDTAGIDVYVSSLGSGYFGAYSRHDQTVKGKAYPKDKLLKSHKYAPIDESKEWWL